MLFLRVVEIRAFGLKILLIKFDLQILFTKPTTESIQTQDQVQLKVIGLFFQRKL